MNIVLSYMDIIVGLDKGCFWVVMGIEVQMKWFERRIECEDLWVLSIGNFFVLLWKGIGCLVEQGVCWKRCEG